MGGFSGVLFQHTRVEYYIMTRKYQFPLPVNTQMHPVYYKYRQLSIRYFLVLYSRRVDTTDHEKLTAPIDSLHLNIQYISLFNYTDSHWSLLDYHPDITTTRLIDYWAIRGNEFEYDNY